MGVTTLLNFRTDVIAALASRITELDNSAQINRWINAGYMEVTGAVDFPELDDVFNVATSSGVDEYAGPTDSAGWVGVYDESNDTLLERVTLSQLYRRDRSTNDTPEFWSRKGDTLILSPKPDTVINERIIHKKTPALLDDDADLTSIPGTWDQAIYLLAVSNGHLSFAEENRATFWRNLAVAYIQSRFTEGNVIAARFAAVPQGA